MNAKVGLKKGGDGGESCQPSSQHKKKQQKVCNTSILFIYNTTTNNFIVLIIVVFLHVVTAGGFPFHPLPQQFNILNLTPNQLCACAMHACVCVHVCVPRIHLCVCVQYMHVCACTHVCGYVCVCAHIYLYVCVCVSMLFDAVQWNISNQWQLWEMTSDSLSMKQIMATIQITARVQLGRSGGREEIPLVTVLLLFGSWIDSAQHWHCHYLQHQLLKKNHFTDLQCSNLCKQI